MTKLRSSSGYRKLRSFQTATIRKVGLPEHSRRGPCRVKDQTDPSDLSDQIPTCPKCNKPMVLRTAKQGKNAGQSFRGCSGYPECKEVVTYNAAHRNACPNPLYFCQLGKRDDIAGSTLIT